MIICFICLSLIGQIYPASALAFKFSIEWSETYYGSISMGSYNGTNNKDYINIESIYQCESASDLDDVIDICKKYNNKAVITGVRNQITWMEQLYYTATEKFNSKLGMGDVIILALLNHTDILTTLLTSNYSTGDIKRIIAQQIFEGKKGYTAIDAIAAATDLAPQEVREILERIAAGSITEDTISAGKKHSKYTNRGPYLRNQALRQEKVYNYLLNEIKRMASNSETLEILYNDFGSGYVEHLLSGKSIDEYQVKLYKEHLAKTLDKALKNAEADFPATMISKSEFYKAAKKTQSTLSKIYKYMLNEGEEALPVELEDFLKEHLENGVLSESEAREILILSGEYEKGEHGIGEAARQLIKGYKHLQNLESAFEVGGKVIDAIDKIKKAEELIEYWTTNYAQQEIILDNMVESLKQGTDTELMIAAEELQKEYKDRISGTFDKVYSEVVTMGIGKVKSSFPPLGIAETCIGLAAELSDTDKHVDAVETGFAMLGICKQALEDYESAVKAVAYGNTSEEAVNQVLYNYEVAKQSLITYYEGMVDLSITEAEKNTYIMELNKLQNMEFGYVVVNIPFGGGKAGGR